MMNNSTPSDRDSGLAARGQQSPLASQRAKQQNNSQEQNRTGKMGGFFTLGYKEGFAQWVRMHFHVLFANIDTNSVLVGEHTSRSS